MSAVRCGGDSQSALPTSGTPTGGVFTEIFTGNLAAAGTSFHTFTVASAGTGTIMLASLQNGTTPVVTNVSVGLGTPDVMPNPTACTVTSPQTIAPALTFLVTGWSVATGDACVGITGNTTGGTLAYAIRVRHP